MSDNRMIVWLVALTVVALIFFAGSPDLQDALIVYFSDKCLPTTTVETP